MKNYYSVAIGLMAIALGIAPPANAVKTDQIALNFTLPPTSKSKQEPASAQETVPKPTRETEVKPLNMPNQASIAPLGSTDRDRRAELPPPPPQASDSAVARASQPIDIPSQTQPIHTPDADSGILSFAPDAVQLPGKTHVSGTQPEPEPPTAARTTSPQQSLASAQTLPEIDALFHAGPDSLVARAVGSAEGTRTPKGEMTRAYRGHVDPGNGVWNLGTFSYQHGAKSPEEADRKQLNRLKGQAQTLRQKAEARGINLTLEEELNGIDLANQSPRAALSRGGYIDRLEQAREMGLQGSDAVLWARTRAFLDPDTSHWNAPGLGNNVHSITNDQERRRRAINRAIEAQPKQAADPLTSLSPQTVLPPKPKREEVADRPPEEINADQIINLDLSNP